MEYKKFEPFLGDWGEKLRPFIESEEMDKIYTKLKTDSGEGREIFPASTDTYRAFEKCPFSSLKAVIIGLDPYPKKLGKTIIADGLAFSCSNTGKLQPSLDKLYEAIEDDLYDGMHLTYKKDPDLTYLAKEGVLLLNSALTVEKDKTGSHTQLWNPFMKFLIEEVLNTYTYGLVFLLMGKDAQEMKRYILPFNHWVFETEHPSYANRQERPMRHLNIFSKTNKVLKDIGGEKHQINWLKEVKP